MAMGVKGSAMSAEEKRLRKNALARERHAANPDKLREKDRRRYAADPGRRRCDPEKARERNRVWRVDNPEKAQIKSRVDHWRFLKCKNLDGTQFDMNDYDEMFAIQGGMCKLCGKPPPKKLLCVDHNHRTEKVRGLLCHGCNTGLGKLGDNAAGLWDAFVYVSSSKKSALEYAQAACA